MGFTSTAMSFKTIAVFSILPLALFAAWLAGRTWPDGADYHYHFYPAARLWLEGGTHLYDEGMLAAGVWINHPPWTVWLSALFAMWPYDLGRGWLFIISVASLAFAALTFGHGKSKPWALAFALFNLHTFDLLFRGQLDAFSVLGATLGWLALRRTQPWLMAGAFIALMIKPPNTIPVAFFFLWAACRTWTLRQVAISLAPPTAMALLTLIIFPGWPGRWLAHMSSSPPPLQTWLTTTSHMQDQLGLPSWLPFLIAVCVVAIAVVAWREAGKKPDQVRTLDRMLIVLASTFLITPYALSYHYVVLTAVALPVVLSRHTGAGVVLYLLTFLPVLRVWVGAEYAWVDLLFAAAVFGGVIMRAFACMPSAHAPQFGPLLLNLQPALQNRGDQ